MKRFVIAGAVGLLAATVQAAAGAAAPREPVVMKTPAGDVTFRHASHRALACDTCHSGAPGPLELDKERAHALCRGCHQREQRGPYVCNQCHAGRPRK